ncbi:SRPBCC family protein [Streptomyces sp. RB6PN25]|uniref:SRPBCC family protein n=1 Tax=Streptomyces humicola TaxID=2953240 RepID=A0ABT1Q4Z6_9ACTN|nr:SRPBCC family protein [Streptomyces humicola]MCQ4085004.1 SRPBCC family protein [Streptomyces humicola]
MSTLEEQIDINAPARQAWECLHSVKSYPEFVDGVRAARQEGTSRAHLDLDAGGKARVVDAEISDRGRDQLMMWRTTKGAELEGTFTLLPIDEQHTRLQARLTYDPAKVNESFGGPKGFAQSDAIAGMVRHDLEQFKALVEREA